MTVEETPVGIIIFEKIIGLILLIIGAIVAYAASNLSAGDISNFAVIFIILGLVLAAVGLLLIIAKGK